MNKFNIKPRRESDKYKYPGKADITYTNLLLKNGVDAYADIFFSDIFEFKLVDGTVVYGCFVLKHSTRQIPGILFDYTKESSLVSKTLDEAKEHIVKNSLFHSDQGKQYGSETTVMTVSDLKMQISMSRAGTPTDNPFAERFVRTFKLAVVKKRPYLTLGDFLEESFKWINFYHNVRPHESLEFMTPNSYAEAIGHKSISLNTVFRVH